MAPLEIRTFPGAGGGMDQAGPAHMLPDSKARWIIDALVDRAGLVRQRGKTKGSQIASDGEPNGMASAYSPDGVLKIAVPISDNNTTNYIKFIDEDNASLGQFDYAANFNSTLPPTIFHKSAIVEGAGQFISLANWLSGDAFGAFRFLGLWRGGSKATYSTGTITCARGQTGVTGSGTTWSTNVVPGMFLLRDNGAGTYRQLGVVKTVNSNTSITLEDVSIMDAPAASNYVITSIRGLAPRIVVGRISGAAGQAVVNGTGTKFKQIGTGSTWSLYRARDNLFLGNVSTIQSDTQLTLAANIPAGGDVATDKYFAAKIDDTFLTTNPNLPFLTAVWQNRQWYANQLGQSQKLQSNIWYSDLDDAEGLDFTKDGWNLEIPSSGSAPQPIFALAAIPDALLIFKEQEVYKVTGTADPASWVVSKVSDNGVLCPMSIVPHRGGILWASDAGIMFYDGTTVKNLVEDSLGDFWIKGVKDFEPKEERMWAFTERNHYFLHIEGAWTFPTGAGYYKGSTESAPASLTFCLNLDTEAIVILTNVGVRGNVYVPPVGTNEGTNRIMFKRGSDASSYISKGNNIFFDEGTEGGLGGGDDFDCHGHAVGPDFYIESARYDMDDPQIRKLWKQLQIHYISNGQPLTLDTVLNFETNGTTTTSAFAASASFINKRFKFLKRGQLMAFRLYVTDNQPSPGGDSPATRVELGPWAVGFKRQRPGRV